MMSYTNHREEVLRRIKSSYKKAITLPRNIKLPGKQDYHITDNHVKILLSDKVVCSNMQTDECAFEGWSLVIKYWGGFDSISLYWHIPDNVYDGHYQRFLFRVQNFVQYNNAWFSVCDSCKPFLTDLKIVPNTLYYLNSPGKYRLAENHHIKETILECRFAMTDLRDSLMEITAAEFINRQLPVGVFEGFVANNNGIFTKKKSAIDLWGIDRTNDLLIFELKVDRNCKVGIVSELFFYTCVMVQVLKGNFKNLQTLDNDIQRISHCNRIKAYFLAYDLHPLLYNEKEPSILKQLNSLMPDLVEYHFIRICRNELLMLEY